MFIKEVVDGGMYNNRNHAKAEWLSIEFGEEENEEYD